MRKKLAQPVGKPVVVLQNVGCLRIRELRGEELYKSRSSQLEMQLLQLRKERLKKIQTCMGFEPLTSAIPVQRSFQMRYQANWEQIVELVCYKPVKG